VSPKKSKMLMRKVTYLGHCVTEEGIAPDDRLVEAIQRFPRPSSKEGVRSFLGTAGYYGKCIPDYAEKASPLTDIMGARAEWVWEAPQEVAF
jgi:hypothetical protein